MLFSCNFARSQIFATIFGRATIGRGRDFEAWLTFALTRKFGVHVAFLFSESVFIFDGVYSYIFLADETASFFSITLVSCTIGIAFGGCLEPSGRKTFNKFGGPTQCGTRETSIDADQKNARCDGTGCNALDLEPFSW